MTTPQITVADLRALAHGASTDPVLYVDEDGDLDVWDEAHVPHHLQVLTREQLRDVLGGDLDDFDDFDFEDVLAGLQQELDDRAEP